MSPPVLAEPPLLLPPDDLIHACAAGDCVLYAGPGISAQAGFPTWREGLAQLLGRAGQDHGWTDVDGLQEILSGGRTGTVAEVIAGRLDRPTLQGALEPIFAATPEHEPPVFRELAALPFNAVLTPSWDQLLDRAFADRLPDERGAFTPRDSDDFAALFRDSRFVLLKLHGDPFGRSDTEFSFTSEEYQRTIVDNPSLSRYLVSLYASRSLLFAGTSLEGIEFFLTNLGPSANMPSPSSHRHYALVPWQYDIEIHAERFEARWGVRLLPYMPDEGHPEVAQFFASLRDAVEALTRETTTKSRRSELELERVALVNIGPFTEFALDFHAGWNVILGDNGCGKSTVLRAIGLGMCGDDERAARYAASLLRSGASSGSIEVTIGGVVYRTDLIHDGQLVRVRSGQLTPLQAGSWVMLGFPPLRGVTSRNPRGPSGDGVPDPVIDDLLPIVAGSVDSRVDGLKQWIVNTHLRAEDATLKHSGGASSYARLRDSFFEILDVVTPGLTLEFQGIDRVNWQVMVRTDDGVVPIDLVSQGTSSILGWVGALMQRMHEIHADSERPEQESALVIVDEIDAHMHPAWQQQLVPLVRERFPGLQVIATTHSPLIVGSLDPSDVTHLRRDEETGTIVSESLVESVAGWRADQILTSPAFNLETTRSSRVNGLLDEYRDLLGKSRRTDAEQRELRQLEAQVEQVIPAFPETAAEREGLDLAEAWMEERLLARSEEHRRKVLAAAREFLSQSGGEV